MMAWPLVALADLCEINVGRTPSRARSDYWGVGEPWLSIADMNQGRDICATKETVTPLAVREAVAKQAEPGTVLLSFKLSIGKVGIARRTMFTNEAIAALPVMTGVPLEPEYLARALEAQDLAGNSNRAAMGATLNKAKLQLITIPLPPVGVQRRIAAILERADTLRAKRREALTHLDDLIQSIFLHMFGDPVTNPRRLPTRRLGDWGLVTTGNTPSRAEAANFGHGIEWIKSDNLATRTFIASRAAERLTPLGEQSARTVPEGSILVTCIAGSPNSIGNAAIIDRRVAFNQQINALTASHTDPYFLLTQLRVGKRLVQEQSTGGMKGLVNKSAFSSIQLLDPPVEEQLQLASKVRDLLRETIQHSDSLARVNELYATLQKSAFSATL